MAGRSQGRSRLRSSSRCWAPSADSLLLSSGCSEPRESSPDPEGPGGKRCCRQCQSLPAILAEGEIERCFTSKSLRVQFPLQARTTSASL